MTESALVGGAKPKRKTRKRKTPGSSTKSIAKKAPKRASASDKKKAPKRATAKKAGSNTNLNAAEKRRLKALVNKALK